MASLSPPGDPLDDVAVRSARDTALLLAKFDEAIAAALEDVAPPPPQTSARPPLHAGPVGQAGSAQGREAVGGGREAVSDEGGSGWFTPKRDNANAAVDETLLVTPGGGRFTRMGREEPSLVTPPRGRVRAEIEERERRERGTAAERGTQEREEIHARERERARELESLARAEREAAAAEEEERRVREEEQAIASEKASAEKEEERAGAEQRAREEVGGVGRGNARARPPR
ncbi:hypothetical protein T484DRAFT_1792742 [Baffinella frigidus]|nr:hypothetical protein T484DRAFT_1792742 [Cryptophyta sp. CCMP2293]